MYQIVIKGISICKDELPWFEIHMLNKFTDSSEFCKTFCVTVLIGFYLQLSSMNISKLIAMLIAQWIYSSFLFQVFLCVLNSCSFAIGSFTSMILCHFSCVCFMIFQIYDRVQEKKLICNFRFVSKFLHDSSLNIASHNFFFRLTLMSCQNYLPCTTNGWN